MVDGFRGVVTFLDTIGVYDIVLPFLLIFTIVFAVLDKTKILGVDKIDNRELSKKNLNSMVAFVMALIVIASAQLVRQISRIMADVALLLVLAICFLMLVGVFFKDEQFDIEKIKGWKAVLVTLMFAGIVIIFLNALGWLDFVFKLIKNFNADWAATTLFLLITGGFMYYVVRSPSPSVPAGGESPKKGG
ncbi:TPA: hypothetical protein HA241_00245 [Candidatus Woesearchaeota archaeon]|nr:hypothetical protein [Candidatus Woesearchaeota archaeon]